MKRTARFGPLLIEPHVTTSIKAKLFTNPLKVEERGNFVLPIFNN